MLDALVAEARLRWGLDPADGLQVVAGERLVGDARSSRRDPSSIVPARRCCGRIRRGRAAVAAARPAGPAGGATRSTLLRRLYPADHPVGRFGAADATTIGIARRRGARRAALPRRRSRPSWPSPGPGRCPGSRARLRQPDGCPWDREQTHTSLRKHLLEEAYEVYDALEAGATPALAGELGDLLLQIVLHAQLAAEAGVFDLADVQAAIATKIVRRHPHVFGDAEARTAADVNRQWERIKAAERAAAADAEPTRRSAAARRARSTGSAPRCRRSPPARRCRSGPPTSATTGRRIDGVLDKVAEEADELREAAATDAERAEEFGDLLFVLVNVARRRGIEAEAAVRAANAKFRRRFASVERGAAAQGRRPARPGLRRARRAVGCRQG